MSKFAASFFFFARRDLRTFLALVAKTVKNKDCMTALMKILGTWDFILEVLEINAIRTEK